VNDVRGAGDKSEAGVMKKGKKKETETCRNERQSVEERNQNKELIPSGLKDRQD
jgi:hypothetical protein